MQIKSYITSEQIKRINITWKKIHNKKIGHPEPQKFYQLNGKMELKQKKLSQIFLIILKYSFMLITECTFCDDPITLRFHSITHITPGRKK